MDLDEISRLFSLRESSPRTYIDQITPIINETQNNFNAFSFVDWDGMREKAQKSSERWACDQQISRFDGVPFTVKGSAEVKGWPISNHGSIAKESARISAESSQFVATLESLGMIPVGRTTMSEFGWQGTSYSPLNGYVKNPQNPDYDTGGSSAGAAVAASENIGPLAHATDGGGSIRIPAGFCGVYGWKPTPGLIKEAISPKGNMATHGLMSSRISSLETIAPFVAAQPPCSGISETGTSGYHIGRITDLGPQLRYELEVAEGLAKMAHTSEKLGDCEEVVIDISKYRTAIQTIWSVAFANYLNSQGIDSSSNINRGLKQALLHASTKSSYEVQRAHQAKYECEEEFRRLLRTYDVLITPTAAITGIGREELDSEEIPWNSWFEWAAPAWMVNFAGLPAVTVPIGKYKNGLSASYQIIGKPFGDNTLFGFAREITQIEQRK